MYGCGISRSGILRLANQHNEVNRVQRATSLSEVAASCRRLMFVHFGEGMDDDGTQMPQIPRYNSQPYIKWKSECLSYLSSPTTVSLTLLCELSAKFYLYVYRVLPSLRQPYKWHFSLQISITQCKESLQCMKRDHSWDSLPRTKEALRD